jgi:flagellin-like protein
VKGISPLVAAVLLIAVTMTIAGVLAYWASGFVQQQTALFSNETVATECNFAKFRIYSCNYNSTSQRLNLLLENNGAVNLKNIVVYFIYTDNVTSVAVNTSLLANRLTSFAIDGVTAGFSKFQIRTHCANAFVEGVC